MCCLVCCRQRAPVCSVLGKTYSNECLLHKESCRKKRRIGKAHNGACLGIKTNTRLHAHPLVMLRLIWRGFSFSKWDGMLWGRVRAVPIPSDGLVLTPQPNGREIHTSSTFTKLPLTHTANPARTGDTNTQYSLQQLHEYSLVHTITHIQ